MDLFDPVALVDRKVLLHALPANPDIIGEMRRRLTDVSTIDSVLRLREQFEAAIPEHLDQVDAVQTRSVVNTHLPDLARRFVTAYDASSQESRTSAQDVVMSSLGLVEAALSATMDHHSVNARRALEDQRRFLEARISDPWSDDQNGRKKQ